jgi:hypothetical protein
MQTPVIQPTVVLPLKIVGPVAIDTLKNGQSISLLFNSNTDVNTLNSGSPLFFVNGVSSLSSTLAQSSAAYCSVGVPSSPLVAGAPNSIDTATINQFASGKTVHLTFAMGGKVNVRCDKTSATATTDFTDADLAAIFGSYVVVQTK